jgi:hypothetical protein
MRHLNYRRNAGILPAIDNQSTAIDLPQKAIDNPQTAIDGTIPKINPNPNTEEASKMLALLALLANLDRHPGCLDFCLKSIPVQPWSHQLKILHSF